jgi:outer membrane protein assembly factor BamB
MNAKVWTGLSTVIALLAVCGVDESHGLTRESAASAPQTPQLLWQLELKAPSFGGCALGDLAGDGNVAIVFGTYFGDEHLYAVRANDGKVLWKFKSESGPFDAGVALVDLNGKGKLNVIAADSSTGTLFCLDHEGKVVWRHKLPACTDSPPAVADLDGDGKAEIVVGTWIVDKEKRGRVFAIEAGGQQVKWSAAVPGYIQSEPVLVDLNGDNALDVLVTTWRGDKGVWAFEGKTGAKLWRHEMKGDMYHGVAVVEKPTPIIIAHSIAGDIAALDFTGKVLWEQTVKDYLFAPATLADLAGDGKLSAILCGQRVYAFEAATGKEQWRSKEYGSISRGAAAVDVAGDGKPDLLFGASDRKFHALRGFDGKPLWEFAAKVKGEVYEGIDSGPLAGDFLGDGSLCAFFVAGRGTSDPKLQPNYGRAYAIKIGQGKGSWPMFRGNLRRTGVGDR